MNHGFVRGSSCPSQLTFIFMSFHLYLYFYLYLSVFHDKYIKVTNIKKNTPEKSAGVEDGGSAG